MGGAWGNYGQGGSTETGTASSFSYTDLLAGYSYLNQTTAYSGQNYSISGYNSPNRTERHETSSVYSSESSYTASTFYDVGNQSGYVNNYNQNTGVLNFVKSDFSSFTRTNDYVNFNMADGTSFQAHSSSSTDDLFQYSFDGFNTHYAKIGYTDRDNQYTYSDGVTYIGSTDHEDTLNVSTYDRSVDLRGGEYINIDNIDARNASSTSYYQRNLFGNAGNNKIYAGAGDHLWGGAGDDEGGQGNNAYTYAKGDGNDVIYNSVASDKVYLSNISVDDIAAVGYQENNLNINMASGESLKIVGANGVSNFVLDDSSVWQYHRDTQSISRVK